MIPTVGYSGFLPRCREVGLIPTVGYSGFLPRCREVGLIPTVGYSGFLPRCREVGLARRLFSCHGVVRLGLPDGLVF